MKEYLIKLQKENALCEVYTNPNENDKFRVYQLLFVGDDFILAQAFDRYGQLDGIECLRMGYILKIVSSSLYLKCMQKLISDGCAFDVKSMVKDRAYDFKSLIEDLAKQRTLCEIECGGDIEEIATGFIHNSKDVYVEVAKFDDYGHDDGFELIRAEDIYCVSFNTLETNRLEKLIDKHKNPRYK